VAPLLVWGLKLVRQVQKLYCSALNTLRLCKTKLLRLAEQKQTSYEPSIKETLPGQSQAGGLAKHHHKTRMTL
jgi:hypothetical protein